MEEMVTIVIFVEGGLVQSVSSTNPHTKVLIADRDIIKDYPDSDEIAMFEEVLQRADQGDMYQVW